MNKASLIWLNKPWKNLNNKDLCYCVAKEQTRFNLIPSTVYTLDKLGMNEMEIINLNDCLGKKVGTLPSADVDMLNMLEAKYGILFNGNEKLLFNDNKLSLSSFLNRPLNNILYNKAGENWYGSALLFCKSAHDYFLKNKAA
jgi:hypothetical protein